MQPFSEKAFAGKNIIISGGAGDLGVDIACAFAKAGANQISLIDIDDAQLAHANNVIKALGASVLSVTADLTEEAHIKSAVESIYQSNSQWDILITVAGLFKSGPLIDYSAEDWDQLMSVNARSVFLLSRAVAAKMIEQGHGKIVHIGSSSTFYGTPGSGVYSASKAVVNQLTQTMAVEWGVHNIQVNALCPTVTETKFLNLVGDDSAHEAFRNKLKEKMPTGRLLVPSDISPAVLFLASEAANLINGQIILLDGGARLVST